MLAAGSTSEQSSQRPTDAPRCPPAPVPGISTRPFQAVSSLSHSIFMFFTSRLILQPTLPWPGHFPLRIALLPTRSSATWFFYLRRISPHPLQPSLSPLRLCIAGRVWSSIYRQWEAAGAMAKTQCWLPACGTVHADHPPALPLNARPPEQVAGFLGRLSSLAAYTTEGIQNQSGERFHFDIHGLVWFSWERSPTCYVFCHYSVHPSFMNWGRCGF